MYQHQPKMNIIILKSALQEAKLRINLHREQKINNIAMKKDQIKGCLESGDETAALIYVTISIDSRLRL